MELQLEAFEHFLTNDINLELSQNKLFGILLLENDNLTPLTILEEDFNKYSHVFLTDDYPNIEGIRSQISDITPGYPIVVLN